MVKINDKVYPAFSMGQVGRVVEIRFVPTGMHLIGGTAQQRMYVVIKLDKDGSLIEVPADETMRFD